jgi:prolyl 4-hydroxylase
MYNRLIELDSQNGKPPNPDFIRPNSLVMTAKYVDGNNFNLHTDTGLYYNRKQQLKSNYTLLIYLNDEFEGGQTSFYTPEFKHYLDITPKRGSCAVFDINWWHKGNPVSNGKKYWIGCEIIGKI